MKNVLTISKNVWMIFYLYIGLYYVFPFIMRFFYANEYDKLFTRQDNLLAFSFVIIFIVFVIIVDAVWDRHEILSFRRLGGLLESKAFNYVLFAINLLVSIYFYFNYNLKFRHQESLSNAGGIIMILFLLRSYIKIYLFYILLKFMNGLHIHKYQYLFVGLTTASFILTLMSSFDILFIFVGFLIFIKKPKVIFSRLNKNQNFIIKGFKVLLIGLVGIGIVFVGNANKIGVDSATEIFTNSDNINQIFANTAIRFSVYYASVMSLGSLDFLSNDLAFTSLEGIFLNLKSRFEILIGQGEGTTRLSEAWSVNRMNFLQLYHNVSNQKTGSSPGVIASSFYLPFFPLNFLAIAMVIVFFLRRLSKAVNDKMSVKTTTISNIVLLFFALPLFDNPVDYINIFNPILMYVFMFIGMTDQIEYLKNKAIKMSYQVATHSKGNE